MPPKKPKKSKAELEEERLAREEEERKAKILEDKRNAEDAEKRRLEQLRIEAEHKSQREAELLRLNAEYEEIVDEDKSKELQLIAEEKKENEKLEWARYTDPSDEPDAFVEKDMNTFISLTKETHVEDWKPTLGLIGRVETIAAAVENVWSESLASRDERTRKMALKNLVALRDIISEKLDIATVKLLAFAPDEQLNERQEMNIESTGLRLSVGMWASYADVRPIRKSVIFESIGIQIDLQKQLLQQHDNYVFRVVRMPIVTYNLEAYDISPQAVADILATREPPASTTDAGDGEGEEEAATGTGSRAVTPKASPRPAAADLAAKLPSKYVVGDLFIFDILYAPQSAFHLRVRKWTMRNKSAAATKLRKAAYPSSVPSRVQLKVPEDVLMTDDMRVAVWSEEQKDWVEDAISDYQYNETTRTVQFYITTVGVLALVKKRTVDLPYKKWTLAPVLAKPINSLLAAKLRVSDPSELSAAKLPEPTPAVANAEASDEGKASETAPSEVTHTPEQSTATTAASAVSSTASSLFEQYARLTIHTQKLEIVIDIAGSSCKLMKPVTPVFADMLDTPMNAGTLLRRLLRKGVNILPNAVDLALAERVVTKVRHRVFELQYASTYSEFLLSARIAGSFGGQRAATGCAWLLGF
jgi:hypothetical protein